ncbi:putative replication factor-a protein [Giardia muris]|uniref:Putative replication factor-a protein n=1 Tax=Giardia muris TaxID=5742 RepID=A0A4Z1SPM4_GIAMU|nr:putative replication factor-a protein [Giardia muris]|eukprot:TNJ27772.1 putative replication factor-a protein [Giardia muris]
MSKKPPTPISELVDYGSHAIKGRVVTRKDLMLTKAGKPWFTFVLDDDTGDIKVDCFENANDFSAQVAVGAIIRLDGALVRSKTANDRQYDTSRSDFKVSMNKNTVITLLATADQAPAPNVTRLISTAISGRSMISDAKNAVSHLGGSGGDSSTHICNLLGGVVSVKSFHSPADAARPWERLELTIVDQSDSIRISFWTSNLGPLLEPRGLTLDTVEGALMGKVVCISRVSIRNRDKFGIQASANSSTKAFIEEELNSVDDARIYKTFLAWWQSPEGRAAATSLAMTTPGSPQREDMSGGRWISTPLMSLGGHASGDVIHVLVSVVLDRNFEQATYQGCSNCKRALKDSVSCLNCPDSTARHYWRIGANISDHTYHARVSIFDPYASEIMNMPADDFVALPEQEREQLLQVVFEADFGLRVTTTDDGRERMNIIGMRQKPPYGTIFDQLVRDLTAYHHEREMLH